MSAKIILDDIIQNFNEQKFIRFFREKSRTFKPIEDNLTTYNDEDFSNCQIHGEIKLIDENELIIITAKVNKNLTERSGKKAQYNLGKKILKDLQRYTACIFIFYDYTGNFRFSLIYDIPRPDGKRDYSNFRRYTYFVSKEQTNKTFLQQMEEADFSTLQNIIKAFSVEKVTKEFYQEISNWYFWALRKVKFPDDAEAEPNGRNIAVIRLVTRLIFIWFMKQKGLIKNDLFDIEAIHNYLINLNQKESTYYKAILQNLFFTTLNTKIEERKFRREHTFQGKNKDYMNHNYYRNHNLFKNPDDMLLIFKDIPFLNGGLFECLDKRKDDPSNDTGKEIRIDGFSDARNNQPTVPNFLFFIDKAEFDLNKDYGTTNKKYEVRGLINILQSYNFTIDENTPTDEEVALDPELLGKVFENLLASYNRETATTARKATGSYYTPREIVNYMVDESLTAYLKNALESVIPAKAGIQYLDPNELSHNYDNVENKLKNLISYSDTFHQFTFEETELLINAIDKAKILDPACGSGAFPMGILHKLVHILHKLDPNNERWKKKQLDKIDELIKNAEQITDPNTRDKVIADLENTKRDIIDAFDNNELDYGRKLYLIENCIYGVDIQPIAVQIAKLRFFISLIIDQRVKSGEVENFGIRPLPNLETKFVAANTLIGLEIPTNDLFSENSPTQPLQDDLKNLRHLYFNAKTRKEKNQYQKRDKQLRKALAEEIKSLLIKKNQDEINTIQHSIEQEQLVLNKIQEEPDSIEVIETINLFGQKEHIKINKKEDKIKIQKQRIKSLVKQLESKQNVYKKEIAIKVADKIASFDIFNQNIHAEWFEPEWMFGVKNGFDIVIANPPYVTIRNQDEKLKQYIKMNYKYSRGADIYIAFLEKGLELLRNKANLIFIIPNKFFGADYGKAIRSYLRKGDVEINFIWDLKDVKVFEEALISTIVFSILKKSKQNPVRLIQDDQINIVDNLFDERGKIQIEANRDDNDILIKLNTKKKLSDFAQIRTGVMGFEYWKMKNIIKSNGIINNKRRRIYTNGNFSRYNDYWESEKIKLYKEVYERPTVELSHDYFNENTIALFKSYPKILVRGVSKKVAAIIDEVGSGLLVAVHSILPYDLNDIKWLLGIINSGLINWFHLKTIYSIRIPQGSLKYPVSFFKNLPITEPLNKKSFSLLVDKILKAKQQNPQADTKHLEDQIDIMVYKLYELTYDEVKIIDPNIEQLISKEEYESN
ncbi:MAG: Eco57I restriction-modification methylase domain-containing protein [Bacteroidetes bacterium]|nr:Eco57I restriction-modification methylase domain-containing protein [Bacteroidota bacterium]